MWKLSRARLRSFPRGAGLPQSLSSQLGLHPHTTPAPAGLAATGAHLSLPLPVAHLESRPKEGLQSSYGKGASRAPSPPPQHSVKPLASLTRGHTTQRFSSSPGPGSASQTRPPSADSASGFKSSQAWLRPSPLGGLGHRASPSETQRHREMGGGRVERWQSGSWTEPGRVGRRPAAPRPLSTPPQLPCPHLVGPARWPRWRGRPPARELAKVVRWPKNLSRKVVMAWARRSTAPKKNLEEEDVSPQVLQVEDYPTVRDR